MTLRATWLVFCVGVLAAGVGAGVNPDRSAAKPANLQRSNAFSASVQAPPRVQVAGLVYKLRIVVNNRGPAIRPFCVDFTDDNNSWSISMRGLSSWDSDTFCLGLPWFRRKTLTASLIAAKPGARTLKILVGKSKVYRELHRAVVTDEHALGWQQQFVIVG